MTQKLKVDKATIILFLILFIGGYGMAWWATKINEPISYIWVGLYFGGVIADFINNVIVPSAKFYIKATAVNQECP